MALAMCSPGWYARYCRAAAGRRKIGRRVRLGPVPSPGSDPRPASCLFGVPSHPIRSVSTSPQRQGRYAVLSRNILDTDQNRITLHTIISVHQAERSWRIDPIAAQ